MLDKLTEWAADKPGVVVVRGRWQDVLPSLGTFDRVFFDDYPLDEPPCLRTAGNAASGPTKCTHTRKCFISSRARWWVLSHGCVGV